MTLAKIGIKALKDTTERLKWIFQYPAMTILMGNKIFWFHYLIYRTRDTEDVIIKV